MPAGIYPGNKGRTPWNKGKKTGLVPKTAFKPGRVATEAERLSSSLRGRGNKYRLGKKHSTETRAKMSASQPKGEKNHLWRGGVTPENHRLRNSFEYRLWRTAVFERDNYTCIWCGARSGKTHVYIQADHIKPFAQYPELRFAIDNGRTLCKTCHETTESYPKQFIKK